MRGGAHPRSRGEHSIYASPAQPYRGSSPLARGTRLRLRGFQVPPGLIPARAGNTRTALTFWWWMRAHPRSRGEHCKFQHDLTSVEGSSPLARGTRGAGAAPVGGGGLIPARAGNTSLEVVVFPDFGAHPRSRGEHTASNTATIHRAGSSPLARGTRKSIPARYASKGLIPARAGNTT